jgi:hypothetical protein
MNTPQVNMIHNHNNYRKFPQVSNVNTSNLNNLNQFRLPFPPTIRASDIAQKRLRSRICSKSPNAFFIYRKAFVDQLSNFNGSNKLKMTEVSRLVSSRWKNERREVKEAYEEIAKQVEQELNDIRNKDLVYTDDFDIGRKKKNKNHKRGRRSNSEFGSDAFLMSIKGGNFNISTLDFSVKPNNDDNNNLNDNHSKSSPSQSIIENKESVNYEENLSSDELSSIPEVATTTFDNNYNDYNDDNIHQLQQNNFNLEERSPISEIGFELICDNTLPICDGELNHYILQYQQNEFNLYEPMPITKTNENTSNFSYESFEDRGLDYYLGYFDNFDNL